VRADVERALSAVGAIEGLWMSREPDRRPALARMYLRPVTVTQPPPLGRYAELGAACVTVSRACAHLPVAPGYPTAVIRVRRSSGRPLESTHNGTYTGDRARSNIDLVLFVIVAGGTGRWLAHHEAWSSNCSSRPSKSCWRPVWPLAAASSRWRCRVGRNSMVVWKYVQVSQIDSKVQSSSTGRAQ
jgi:hypothetical protein